MTSRKRYRLQLPTRTLELGRRTLVMGVLNVTPDSFSDGGRYVDPRAAIARALEMEAAGADILDIDIQEANPDMIVRDFLLAGDRGSIAAWNWLEAYAGREGLTARALVPRPHQVDVHPVGGGLEDDAPRVVTVRAQPAVQARPDVAQVRLRQVHDAHLAARTAGVAI